MLFITLYMELLVGWIINIGYACFDTFASLFHIALTLCMHSVYIQVIRIMFSVTV